MPSSVHSLVQAEVKQQSHTLMGKRASNTFNIYKMSQISSQTRNARTAVCVYKHTNTKHLEADPR